MTNTNLVISTRLGRASQENSSLPAIFCCWTHHVGTPATRPRGAALTEEGLHGSGGRRLLSFDHPTNHESHFCPHRVTDPVTPQEAITEQDTERRCVPDLLNPRRLVELQCLYRDANEVIVNGDLPQSRSWKEEPKTEEDTTGREDVTPIFAHEVRHGLAILPRRQPRRDIDEDRNEVDESLFGVVHWLRTIAIAGNPSVTEEGNRMRLRWESIFPLSLYGESAHRLGDHAKCGVLV